MDNHHKSNRINSKYSASNWNAFSDIFMGGEKIIRIFDDLILENMPCNRERALDVGCSIGTLTARVADRFKMVVGVDISLKMLKVAKEKKIHRNIQFINGDFNYFEFKEDSFDFIFLVATLHHLEAEKTFCKIKEILRKDGTLVIIDPIRIGKMNFLAYVFLRVRRLLQWLEYFIKKEGIRGLYTFFISRMVFYNKQWRKHEKEDQKYTFEDLSSLAQHCLSGCRIVNLYPLDWICITWSKRIKD